MSIFEAGYNDAAAPSIASLAPTSALSRTHLIELSRGRVDAATQLAEKVAARAYGAEPGVGTTIIAPVVVASRHGNAEMVERFSVGYNEGHPSPVSYSASGYNIIAQSAARGFNSSGSSLVLAGASASLRRAVMLTAVRMRATGAERGLALSSHSWKTDDGYANAALTVALDSDDARILFDVNFLNDNPPEVTDAAALVADFEYALSVTSTVGTR